MTIRCKKPFRLCLASSISHVKNWRSTFLGFSSYGTQVSYCCCCLLFGDFVVSHPRRQHRCLRSMDSYHWIRIGYFKEHLRHSLFALFGRSPLEWGIWSGRKRSEASFGFLPSTRLSSSSEGRGLTTFVFVLFLASSSPTRTLYLLAFSKLCFPINSVFLLEYGKLHKSELEAKAWRVTVHDSSSVRNWSAFNDCHADDSLACKWWSEMVPLAIDVLERDSLTSWHAFARLFLPQCKHLDSLLHTLLM